MKFFPKPLGVVLAAAALLFGFSACSDGNIPDYVMNNKAVLTGLKIGYAEAGKIPQAIHPDDWNNWDHGLLDEDFETMSFNLHNDLVNVSIKPVASARSRIEWGVGDRTTRPTLFTDTRVPATFRANDYVYLKVTSEDTTAVNYYRFYARVFNAVTHLADVIIDGKKMDVQEGGGEWDSAQEGNIALTTIQSGGIDIEAIGFDPTSTFKFARVTGDGAPDFQEANRLSFTDQDYLYIQVTAQNTIDMAFYKFLVSVGRIAAIDVLKFGTFEVMGKGIPKADWEDVLPGSFATADQPGGGFSINVALEDPAGSVQYGLMGVGATAEPSYAASGNITFPNGGALAIKVTSDNGKGVLYYKVKVELLAANFKTQPKSAAYYYYNAAAANERDYVSPTNFTSDTPVALTFELDRTVSGATYQWWESNSWYGGYGFDKDGRVSYLDEEGATKQEDGFIADGDHSANFDEKKNVSLFNGGNQKAQYLVSGRPIPGAEGTTYTPPINRRPFLAGYSCESHYYWVVVTNPATGYKVTSERATIVSERDKRKKHFIVDVNNYYAPVTQEKIVFKNPLPWSERTKYKIPLHFPADFAIHDYKIVTAQAKFYLVDGTPWVQNWTQGDLSFEVNEDKKVLFYNLTNNNGAYMLDGDSKDPIGANLDDVPTHVVIEPSGDPIKKFFPPLGPDGKADSTIVGTDMQGWFCGYIELVELRFEGPPRER